MSDWVLVAKKSKKENANKYKNCSTCEITKIINNTNKATDYKSVSVIDNCILESILEKIAEKTAHHVAEIYRMKDRGYIREGYFADLVLVDLNQSWEVTKSSLLYKCNWSPFENQIFKSKIKKTIVNGVIVYNEGNFIDQSNGARLNFEKER